MIAINQDELGVAGDLVYHEGVQQVRPPPALSRTNHGTSTGRRKQQTTAISCSFAPASTQACGRLYLQVWAALLKGGSRAVVLFNRQLAHGPPLDPADSPVNITVTWSSLGYSDDLTVRAQKQCRSFTAGACNWPSMPNARISHHSNVRCHAACCAMRCKVDGAGPVRSS